MTEPRRVEILVLGHESEHHNSEKLMMYLGTPLFQKGINLTYTSDPNDLNLDNLNQYDGIMIYANHDSITVEQEAALKEYVESGKGFIPLHSASFCFQNSDWYVEAVGGQFQSHGTGDFKVDIGIVALKSGQIVTDQMRPYERWQTQANTFDTLGIERCDCIL